MTYPRKHSIKTHLTILFLSTLALLTSAYAQITPTADSYTNTGDPTTNYGSKTLLDVDGATQVTYIQFNLASIPSSATVSQATLKLYVNTVTTAGSFNVDYVSGTWLESTIDSSHAPALGAAIASNVAITTADKNQYILINITPAVQAWLSGSETNNGIALVANSTFNATFDSKENTTTSHPPELDIVFAGSGSGITGITTASGSGLTGGGTSGTLNLSLTTACASGQILQWNGSAWACANASGGGTVTSVAAGTGLTASPSPVTTSGTLSINTAVVPQLGTANTFTSSLTVDGSMFMIGDARVDYNGLNKGTTSPGIRFGTGNTGEGISSDRAGTVNGNGIDLYTDFTPRLSVTNGGSVGIGTTSPAATLDIHGTVNVTGAVTLAAPITFPATQTFGSASFRSTNAALLRWYPQTFTVGTTPSGLAFDGSNIWVTNTGSNSVTVLNAGTGAVVGTYSVPNPQGIAFDGINMWVTNYNTTGTVTKLLASTGAVIGAFTVGQFPYGVAFDGTNIWVSNYGSGGAGNTVTELLDSTGAVENTYTVGPGPTAMAFDGTYVWVADSGSTGANILVGLSVSGGSTFHYNLTGKGSPAGLAFDGARLWITFSSGEVCTVPLVEGSLPCYSVGTTPEGVAFDGTNIWVANSGSNNVTELLDYNGAVESTRTVGNSPLGVIFDGSNIWVANSGSNTVTKIPVY